MRRVVTLGAAAAIGAVALITSCTAQATHDVPKAAISTTNGGTSPNVTVAPGSQIPPVSMSRIQPGLPAAIRLVTSGKRRFLALPSGRIEPDGQQHHPIGLPPPPTGTLWVDAPRTWVRVAAGYVEFGQRDAVVWRSRREYNIGSAQALWSDAYSPAGAAFQIGRRGPLYVARSGGAENRVAFEEWADSWTRSGTLLTFAKEADGFSMRLRAPDGSLVRTLATGLTINEIDGRTEVGNDVLYLAHGTIWRTDGRSVRALASLSSLGFTSQPSLYGIGGGLVEVLGRDWHDVILRRDGSVFAEPTPPPTTGYAAFGVNLANRGGTTVAYEIVNESTWRATVYLLRAGETQGTPVLRIPNANPCDFPFSWRGSWLLFRSLNGNSYAIPSAGGRPIRLPRRISGERVSSARWA